MLCTENVFKLDNCLHYTVQQSFSFTSHFCFTWASPDGTSRSLEVTNYSFEPFIYRLSRGLLISDLLNKAIASQNVFGDSSYGAIFVPLIDTALKRSTFNAMVNCSLRHFPLYPLRFTIYKCRHEIANMVGRELANILCTGIVCEEAAV